MVVVALWMGSKANQWQKLPVAAFAAALAGWLVLYAVVKLGWTRGGGRGPRVGRRAGRPVLHRPRMGDGRLSLGSARVMTLLRAWLIGTTIIVSALAIWAFAPVLVFLALLAGALGLLSAVMIAFARALGAWRDRRAGK